MKFPYPVPLAKLTLVLESIGEVEVSTVKLGFAENGYETCLFWDALNEGEPESSVVSKCFDEDKAMEIHAEWCDAAKLAKHIHEVVMQHIQHMGRN